MNEIKSELYSLCIAYVKQRIDTAKQAINDAQQAASEETKSSAGDKYETSREMIQQVTDRSQAQLNEANKLLIALNQINVNAVYETTVPGSLITTNNGRFYIAISAGALTVNDDTYFAVSPASPIGLSLRGQKTGGQFSLNGKQYLIENIA